MARRRADRGGHLGSRRALRDARDPRGPGARPRDGRDHDADLPDVDLRAGGGRRPQGLRLRPRREPDENRAAGVHRVARGSCAWPRVLLRPRRGDHPHAPALTGRSRGRRQRRVRRHLPHVHAGVRAEGVSVHVPHARRDLDRARRASRGADEVRLARDADEPGAQHRRHRRRVRSSTRGRRTRDRRQHLRDAVSPATARARRRRGAPLDDEVPRRPFRRDRRVPRDERRHTGRAARVLAEITRSGARPVRRVARPARREDARRTDGSALRERDRGRRLPRATSARPARHVPGPALPPGPHDRRATDEELRRNGLVPSRRRAGGGRPRCAHEDLEARREPRRRREPHRAPCPDDARVDGRCAVRRAADADPPVGRNRVGRGPHRGPRRRARG